MPPAHRCRRRDDQPVRQLERGLGVARAGDCRRGGDLGRRRRGSDRGDAVDAEREAGPVEHALDSEGDARFSRHLEDQPAAPPDANGGLAGRVDGADGGGWRLRLCVGRHVGLQDRRFVVAALGDRLRLEMDDQEGRLVGILDDQRRRLALRPVDAQVARFHVQAQQVVRPDNLEGESHGLPLACRGCRRGAWKSNESRRVRRVRRDIATLPRATSLRRFEKGAQMDGARPVHDHSLATREGGAAVSCQGDACSRTANTRTGWSNPFRFRASSSTSGVFASIASAVTRSTRIWLSSALAHSREARFTTLPTAV